MCSNRNLLVHVQTWYQRVGIELMQKICMNYVDDFCRALEKWSMTSIKEQPSYKWTCIQKKRYKLACALFEHTDQHPHAHMLIWVFDGRCISSEVSRERFFIQKTNTWMDRLTWILAKRSNERVRNAGWRLLIGPRRKITCLRGFWRGEIQTSMLSYRD